MRNQTLGYRNLTELSMHLNALKMHVDMKVNKSKRVVVIVGIDNQQNKITLKT